MSQFKQFLMKASLYTVVILSVFYIFGAISGITEHGISWHKYLLILGYGLLISLSEMISGMMTGRKALGGIINYTVLLSGFLIIFVFSTKTTGSALTKAFVAIVLFSAVYALLKLVIYLIKKAVSKKTAPQKQLKNQTDGKTTKYRSLYGDN